MLGWGKRGRRHRTEAEGAEGGGRGRRADSPSEIPASGWRDVAWRVKDEQTKDNISIVAAGVAFYFLLALFPALGAMVALWSVVGDPVQLAADVEGMTGVLPDQARQLISGQLRSMAESSGSGGFWALVGIAIALWSASKGVKSLMTALNIAYDEEERRSFLHYNAMALLLTLAAILFIPLVLVVVAAVPPIISAMGLGSGIEWVLRLVRWPILAVLITVALAILYRLGPSRDGARWQWVSWGAAFATVVWLLASIAFSVYVSNFGSYNETYGSFGAIIILLLWFDLTAYVILLGGELNAELEHQTARDTTVGATEPMGMRGARMADTVGRKP